MPSRAFRSRSAFASIAAVGLLAFAPGGGAGAASPGRVDGPIATGSQGAAIKALDIPTRSGTLTLMALTGAVAKVNPGAAITVTAGAGFQLQINAGIGQLSRSKQDAQANTTSVFTRFVLDEPPLGMVYEAARASVPEHHLLFIVRGVLGGLVCQDVKGPVYSEAQARAMYAACKTLTLKAPQSGEAQ